MRMLFSLSSKIAPTLKLRSVAKAYCSTGNGSRSFTSGVVRQKDEDSRDDRGGEERDFYLSVLKSSSTKREARSYLQRFVPKPNGLPVGPPTNNTPSSLPLPYTDLQNLTAPNSLLGDQKARTSAWIQRMLSHQQAITPTDFIYALPSTTADFFTPEIREEQIHLALVKIRQVQNVSDGTLRGIGKTLVKLRKLGLIPAVVIDPLSTAEGRIALSSLEWRKEMRVQSERVVEAIEQAKGHARTVDGACMVKQLKRSSFTLAEQGDEGELEGGQHGEEVSISLPHLIIAALSHGTIPVLAPIAFNNDQKAVEVNADSIILALVRLFSASTEIALRPSSNAEPSLLSVDKIIYIDPLGGIPSTDRPNNSAHVFLNMQQEYEAVREELVTGTIENQGLLEIGKEIHLRTLATLRKALAVLPGSSSAMITTPDAAAVTTRPSRTTDMVVPAESSSIRLSAGTIMPQLSPTNKVPLDRNPLIHNLLTDKPVFSSSLPISSPNSPYTTSTTLLKHGIPLLIMTNPAYPYPGHKVFKLNDEIVDLDRLFYLIEDSFGRKLDVERYLKRVNDKIAGLIVAGEYEGAAIVTWETDGRTGGGYGARGLHGWKKVLYLDKFAVLRKSQGAGGVADVVFKAMAMGVFPGEGILWRSRKENVVNKWYFERAKGTYRIPDSGWTMFWTGGQGKELDGGRGKFEQYLAICRSVEPSFKG